MNKIKKYIFSLLFVMSSVLVLGQSALTLTGGASISIEENTTLTVQGSVLASSGTDTASISPRGKMELTGHWENNSNGKVVDLSDGNIEFNGSLSQEIRGENAFNNLIINNTAGVSIVSDFVDLNNELQLTAGNFDTGNRLTLISVPSKTARIAPILTGSITGDVTIQAFVENEAYDFRFLSMPVQNKTLVDWSDDFLMTGFTGTPYPSFHFNNIFYYDETQTGDRNARYDNATTINDPIALGVGVQAYIGAADILIDVTGEIYSGVINFPVTFTDDIAQDNDEDGWNLLGNPYPSTVDWNSSEWIKVNINDAIYVYEGSNDAYQSYINGVGTNGGTQYIPSSQSFWVKATGAPTLIANENVKTAENAGFIEQQQTQEVLRLSLSNTTHTDEVVVRFNQEATSKFDRSWDAYKLKGSLTNPILTAIQDSTEYSILSSSIDSLDLPIYLQAEVPKTGIYTLNVTGLPASINCIFLEDLFTGRIESLRDSSSFSFHLSDTTTIARFKITVSKVANYNLSEALCHGDSSYINMTATTLSPIHVTRYSSPNFITQIDSNQVNRSYGLNNGIHYFDADLEGCSTQKDTFIVSSPLTLTSQIIANPDTGFATGSALISVNGGVAPYQIVWSTKTMQNGETVEGLSAGLYTVNIIDKNGCAHSDSVLIQGVVTSIKESTLIDGITVYPNPVGNILHLEGEEIVDFEYKLLDALGREVLFGRIDKNTFMLDVKTLKSGIYFLQLTNGEEYKTLKIKKI